MKSVEMIISIVLVLWFDNREVCIICQIDRILMSHAL
jgi:hypothetical protein